MCDEIILPRPFLLLSSVLLTRLGQTMGAFIHNGVAVIVTRIPVNSSPVSFKVICRRKSFVTCWNSTLMGLRVAIVMLSRPFG